MNLVNSFVSVGGIKSCSIAHYTISILCINRRLCIINFRQIGFQNTFLPFSGWQPPSVSSPNQTNRRPVPYLFYPDCHKAFFCIQNFIIKYRKSVFLCQVVLPLRMRKTIKTFLPLKNNPPNAWLLQDPNRYCWSA